MQTRFTVKKEKTQGQKSLRCDLAVYKTSEILKVPRALMGVSHQADQRATPTCIYTSTRHSANRLTLDEKNGIINSPKIKNL